MQPPVIDKRDMKALLQQMREMVPFYTPEWKFTPEDPDAGATLFLIFADMLSGNIKRYNRMLLNNRIAFANLFNISQQPAQAARAYVTFRLSVGAGEPVFVPAGTQVAAEIPDEQPVVYETDRNMLVTPALPTEAYSVSFARDSILESKELGVNGKPEGSEELATIFDFSGSGNLQEHCVYFGHEDALNVEGPVLIKLEFGNTEKRFKEKYIYKKLSDPELVEWLYYTGEGWRAFAEAAFSGNALVLKKPEAEAIEETEIQGIWSRWIKCRLRQCSAGYFSDIRNEIELDQVKIAVEPYGQDGVSPDMLFSNETQLEKTGFYPFGEFAAPFSAFYLSSREALSKKGALIAVECKLKYHECRVRSELAPKINWKLIMKAEELKQPEPVEITISKVIWEYWNGSGWVKLPVSGEPEEVFGSTGTRDGASFKARFSCPEDIAETYVNEQLNYWIRIRVLNVHNLYEANTYYVSPWMEALKLDYRFQDGGEDIEACVTYNNLEYRTVICADSKRRQPFKPFYSMECRHPSLYLGFELPPVKGPISILFPLKQDSGDGQPALMEWEYCKRKGNASEWSVLKVRDETGGLRHSGIVTFAGPADMAQETCFGKCRYWIRLVNLDDKYENRPVSLFRGLYMNTTTVIQQESIEKETFDLEGDGEKRCVLERRPVLCEEVWINERDSMDENELQSFAASDKSRVREVKDEDGNLDELWVRWEPVEDFLDSGARDRHYTINKSSGIICFGDGINGMQPPSAGISNVMVRYKTSGGSIGNVNAFDIKNLRNSIAFVDNIYNPLPAIGGCDLETVEEALFRSPQLVKSRDRAITAEDFEHLALQASKDIARVSCLAGYNSDAERESGCVTLVVVPKGGQAGSLVFSGLKRRVEQYVYERASNIIVNSGKLAVIEPVYVEVSIYALLAVNDMDAVALVEKKAGDELNRFLDTYGGNHDGKGWDIGRYVHISTFHALLKSIKPVNYIKKLTMTVYTISNGTRSEINPAVLEGLPHGIITNGRHRIDVETI